MPERASSRTAVRLVLWCDVSSTLQKIFHGHFFSFSFFFLRRMGYNKASAPTLPHIRYMCFDFTHAPVATAARAAAAGLVSMSTRPDPERSGTVEMATRRYPRLRVVCDLREPSWVVYQGFCSWGGAGEESDRRGVVPDGSIILRRKVWTPTTQLIYSDVVLLLVGSWDPEYRLILPQEYEAIIS